MRPAGGLAIPPRIVRAGLLLVLLALAACTSGGKPDIDAIVPKGVTDKPAAGFDPLRPGTEEELIMTAGRRVYFAKGSAALDDVAKETLDLQAAWLNQNTTWLIKLQGYADDPGSGFANTALSDKRAKAVMDYLASRGVNPQRMWAKGYGKEELVRDCAKLECQALNRRVVTNLRTQFDEAAPQFKQG
jgi:outer membrane protein OmpA-like peptidoglycan-associated protein